MSFAKRVAADTGTEAVKKYRVPGMQQLYKQEVMCKTAVEQSSTGCTGLLGLWQGGNHIKYGSGKMDDKNPLCHVSQAS